MRILFPFRVAPSGEGALRYLIEAHGTDERVTVTAINFTDDPSDQPADIAAHEIVSKGAKQAFEIESVVERLPKLSKSNVRNGIVKEATDRNVDLVVLGHELSSLFDRVTGRRVEDRLLNECGVPVTLVPEPGSSSQE